MFNMFRDGYSVCASFNVCRWKPLLLFYNCSKISIYLRALQANCMKNLCRSYTKITLWLCSDVIFHLKLMIHYWWAFLRELDILPRDGNHKEFNDFRSDFTLKFRFLNNYLNNYFTTLLLRISVICLVHWFIKKTCYVCLLLYTEIKQ